MNTYIFASSKEWHHSEFSKLQEGTKDHWEWVTAPDKLESALQQLQPRYVFFLHWSWLVPDHVFSKFECVCFHMTDVPYGRGGSPLQNLIKAGHTETKLTALRMIEAMDAGPVYCKKVLSLAGRAEEIYKRAGVLSGEIIRWIIQEQPTPVAQEGAVTIFKRRNPAQSELPDSGSLESVYDHIRMLDAPTYPLGFIQYGEFVIEFSDGQQDDDTVKAQVVIRKRTSLDEE